MFDEKAAADLKVRVRDLPVRITAGMEGLCELAALPEADMVLNAVVGMVGLLPTLAAVRAGHDVALANKETLVAGGALVMDAVARRGVKLLPVDSEHSAIFQCLQGRPPRERALKRLILTASGRPLFRQKRRRTGTGDGAGRSAASQLEYGGENHHRFRHHDEQGAGAHRGPVAVRRGP